MTMPGSEDPSGPPPPPPVGVPEPGMTAGPSVPWPQRRTGDELPNAPWLRFGGVLARALAWWVDAIIVGIVAGIVAGLAGSLAGRGTASAVITTLAFMVLQAVYFVAMWIGGSRATLGMRLMKLQVGNAFDGRPLSVNQALVRWAVLGLPLQALSLLPQPIRGLGGISFIWYLVLLVSTIASSTRQGVHDRAANSAVVTPVGSDPPTVACLFLLALPVVLFVAGILSLIFLGR